MRRVITPQFQPLSKFVGPYQIGEIGTQSTNQVRAGRRLTTSDFTNYGMDAPVETWDLQSLNDTDGNASLTNGGGVTFNGDSMFAGPGGAAASFPGGSTSHLTASNTLKQGYGTWGLWFKNLPKTTEASLLMTMYQSSTQFAFQLFMQTTGVVSLNFSTDGTTTNLWKQDGTTYAADDRWHFACWTWDGTQAKIYVDGRLDSPSVPVLGAGSPQFGPLFQPTSALLYFGGREVDTTSRYLGLLGPAFIHNDVLTENQIRYLYAAKITAPTRNYNNVMMKVYQYARTKNLVSGDFPTQPLVGYNLVNASTTDNYGSLGKTLTANGTPTGAPGLDGQTTDATYLNGSTQYFSANDSSLPSGTAVRTVGVWVKPSRLTTSVNTVFLSYGTDSTGNGFQFYFTYPPGNLSYDAFGSPVTTVSSVGVSAKWLFGVVVLSASAPVRRIYVDGGIAAFDTTALGSTTLAGANRFKIGADVTAAAGSRFNGVVGTAFICNYELTSARQQRIFNKQGNLFGAYTVYDTNDFLIAADNDSIYVDLSNLPGSDSVEFIFS